jgi:predicted ferric reductase
VIVGAILIALYLVVALAPLGIAWGLGLPARPWLDDFSSALAMLAYATLLVEFVLSGRFGAVTRWIGVDGAMRFHQLFARTVLALVLFHPFLYTLPSSVETLPWDPTAATFLDQNAPAMVAGVVAWVVLGVLVITALAREQLPYRYESWRLGHGIGAAMVAGFGAWHVVGTGRYAGHSDVLTGFWLALLALALGTLAWTYLVGPLLRLRHPYAVASVREVAERTWELTVRPERGQRFDYRAGQFAWIAVRPRPFGVTDNPYSIATPPSGGDEVGFLVKEAGNFSRSVKELEPGARVWLDGPHGTFAVPERDHSGVGLLGGGIGIAPLLGILREMRARGDMRPVRLVFGNRAAEQIVYPEELERLEAETPTEVHHVLAEPPDGWQGFSGMVTAEVLEAVFGDREDHRDWAYLICGPAPMIDAVEKLLRERGVPAGNIVNERFVYD